MKISEEAHAFIFVADYVGVDAAGKINAIGTGFAMSGMQQNGFTAPQSVAAVIDVPGRFAGEECALSLGLYDEDAGTLVELPGPGGQPEALRIQQMATVQRMTAQGTYIPQSMFCRLQMTIAFANGLPLPAGRLYSWRLEIDGHNEPGWRTFFYVPGPPPPPVFGGPAGPADIPSAPSS